MPKRLGRPRKGKERREVYSVRMEPKDADFLRKLGEDNLSEGLKIAILASKFYGINKLRD